jgi:hypothetical protein
MGSKISVQRGRPPSWIRLNVSPIALVHVLVSGSEYLPKNTAAGAGVFDATNQGVVYFPVTAGACYGISDSHFKSFSFRGVAHRRRSKIELRRLPNLQ